MKVFVVCNILPCILHCTATAIQGALKACYYDCVLTERRQLYNAKQVQKHHLNVIRSYVVFFLFILTQASRTLSRSLFHTNTYV